MSKELTPLEALEMIKKEIDFANCNCEVDNAFETIETALKENIELKKENLVLSVKERALEIIKEIFEIKIVIDENENDKSCGTVFLVGGKDLIWTIYETFNKEKIQELKLLKEVLR